MARTRPFRRINEIQGLKEKVPIDLFIEHYGGRVKGVSWTEWTPAHCPFHEDNVASSAVNRTDQRFVCHGCGVRGDILDLAQHMMGGGGIPEAIEFIRREFHVR